MICCTKVGEDVRRMAKNVFSFCLEILFEQKLNRSVVVTGL